MSSTPSISNIPEEIRQQIAGYLNYDDAWSLKQSSRLFAQVIEIPTLASFLKQPWGPSLQILEDWDVVPFGYEACYYCQCFLPLRCYDRKQRRATVARQDSDLLEYDYTTWLPEQHYCLDCGIMNHKYVWGEMILTGYGDPGCETEGILPCSYCGLSMEFDAVCCGYCSACEKCVNMAWLVSQNHEQLALANQTIGCGHKGIIAAMKDLPSETVDIYELHLTDPEDFDDTESQQFFTPRSSTVSAPSRPLRQSPQAPKTKSPPDYLKQVIKRFDSVLRPRAKNGKPALPHSSKSDSEALPTQKWFCEPAYTASQPWSWI